MRRTSIFIATLGFALLSLPAQALTLSLLADPAEVQSGGPVSIDIVATDLGDGEFVSAYEFSISFDPLELAFVADSFAVGSALGSSLDATLTSLQPGAEVVLGSFDLDASPL